VTSEEPVAEELTLEGSVELARIERSGMVESRHIGVAVVVDPEGQIVRTLGDPSALVYPRSTLKLLQALAVLETGVDLDPIQSVLACASHAGTDRHVEVVRSILSAADLDEDALQCPPAWPIDRKSRSAKATGNGKSRIFMECSGKHAAFLLACVHNGWSTEDYLDPSHPLQLRIVETIERMTGESVTHSGVDGCGAPVHAVSTLGLARAVSAISRPGAPLDAAYLALAIRANPWAIDGDGRENTVAIERLGVIAKSGAEGTVVMAAPDGTSVAAKILDGSGRARTLVALELLVAAGAVDRSAADEVLELTTEPVLGGGRDVGALVPAFS
jgi:L-asparaginase II